MRAYADVAYVPADGLRGREAYAPVEGFDLVFAGLHRAGKVLAAGHGCAGDGAGVGEELLRRLERVYGARLHERYRRAEVIGLVARVRDGERDAAVALEYGLHLHEQLLAQVAVEGREGLVEHQELRPVHKYPRERDALLLPAGELRGIMVFKPRELHELQVFGENPLARGPVLFVFEPAEDVLPHGHVREERVVLEEIAHAPLLRPEVHALFAVEERDAVELYMPGVRPLDARDAAERHALAAAARAEYAHYPLLGREGHVQLEIAEPLFYVNYKAHLRAPPLCFFSRRFTVRSTTAEMARFMSTHIVALRSSPVRQYW